MNKCKTAVTFRKDKYGVIAVMPEMPGTNNPGTCAYFAKVGQHGACDFNHVIDTTTLATPEEYADLKEHMEAQYGYNFHVLKRVSYKYHKIRMNQVMQTAQRKG